MSKTYTHLTLDDRITFQILLEAKEPLQNPVFRNFRLYKSMTYKSEESKKWGFAEVP